MRQIERHWYRRSVLSAVLLPVSWLYCAIMIARRALFRIGWRRVYRSPAPVIIVGNVTVGGTGKTPLVIWMVQLLVRHGYRPGIVTRGYRGRATVWPQIVHGDSNPAEAGDEPVLLARRAGCPVVADPDRVRAAKFLQSDFNCDVIIGDDGLQHYRLGRDIEIAVIDGARRFGNGRCLPSGPLREPVSRLRSVDACVVTGGSAGDDISMELRALDICTPDGPVAVSAWRGRRVHAVAGIGNPKRFFDSLRALGMDVIEHGFGDHHDYRAGDCQFGDGLSILMTEKDAVKCERIQTSPFSYLRIEALPDARLGEMVLRKLGEVTRG